MRGLFIVFEGIDRTGKSTQSKLLHDALENSVPLRFPERSTVTGQMIS